MKIKGKSLYQPKGVTFYVYREDDQGEQQVFEIKVLPVFEDDVPNDLLEEPEPPTTTHVGENLGKVTKNYKDPAYLEKLKDYNAKRSAWLMLQQLREAEIEWADVNSEDSSTWENFMVELRQFLTPFELIELLQTMSEVNKPTDKRKKEAIENF